MKMTQQHFIEDYWLEKCDMKIKIKSFNGELPEYLTLGKVYDFDKWSDDNDGGIQDDIGIGLYVFLDNCDFLGGGSWEVVDDECN